MMWMVAMNRKLMMLMVFQLAAVVTQKNEYGGCFEIKVNLELTGSDELVKKSLANNYDAINDDDTNNQSNSIDEPLENCEVFYNDTVQSYAFKAFNGLIVYDTMGKLPPKVLDAYKLLEQMNKVKGSKSSGSKYIFLSQYWFTKHTEYVKGNEKNKKERVTEKYRERNRLVTLEFFLGEGKSKTKVAYKYQVLSTFDKFQISIGQALCIEGNGQSIREMHLKSLIGW